MKCKWYNNNNNNCSLASWRKLAIRMVKKRRRRKQHNMCLRKETTVQYDLDKAVVRKGTDMRPQQRDMQRRRTNRTQHTGPMFCCAEGRRR